MQIEETVKYKTQTSDASSHNGHNEYTGNKP